MNFLSDFLISVLKISERRIQSFGHYICSPHLCEVLTSIIHLILLPSTSTPYQFVYLRDNLLSTLEGIEILNRVKVSKFISLGFLVFNIYMLTLAVVLLLPLISGSGFEFQ